MFAQASCFAWISNGKREGTSSTTKFPISCYTIRASNQQSGLLAPKPVEPPPGVKTQDSHPTSFLWATSLHTGQLQRQGPLLGTQTRKHFEDLTGNKLSATCMFYRTCRLASDHTDAPYKSKVVSTIPAHTKQVCCPASPGLMLRWAEGPLNVFVHWLCP